MRFPYFLRQIYLRLTNGFAFMPECLKIIMTRCVTKEMRCVTKETQRIIYMTQCVTNFYYVSKIKNNLKFFCCDYLQKKVIVEYD